MELQCDICFHQFDLDHHRPKVLPCGHTICKSCVQNPSIGRKCPACRKHLAADPGVLPDNILVMQLIEDGVPPRKMPRSDDPQLLQLRRGVDAGRKVVRELQKAVPLAVEALNRLLYSSVAELRRMEEALEKREGKAAAGEGSLTPDQVRVVLEMENSLRLLTTSRCSVIAEHGVDSWRASVETSPDDHILRLLLLQLRLIGQLKKVDVVVGPPGLSTLSIEADDLYGSPSNTTLKVNDILRNGARWKNIRTLKNVQGYDTEKLLRVVAPHLEELEISDCATVIEMEEVKRMKSLKRLLVDCDIDSDDYPGLPLQLEELSISFPSEKQMRCVQDMPSLRSLNIEFYCGPPVSFRPPQHRGGLLWLGLYFDVGEKGTMLSLIRANASSLQELLINTHVKENGKCDHFFPSLGPDLAVCGLRALRRLVLKRPNSTGPCEEVDACLLQRQTVRGFLPSVDVVCYSCHKSYVIG